MAGQAWLDRSLQRSASLGREVLERASRGRPHWTGPAGSHIPAAADEDAGIPLTVPACFPRLVCFAVFYSRSSSLLSVFQRTHSELDDVFADVVHFMAQTTCRCKRFYESGCGTEPTETERNHVSRFHTRPAARSTTPAPSNNVKTSSCFFLNPSDGEAGEDFLITVSPGTYAVTASVPESRQRTRLVSIKDGESVSLTFDL
ncbi:A-kinase-interacting protein 1 isoform X1 [Brachionichthys hirsutus]|uniref:A-kinase-interacting protein 1 isoform X1 n=1 Tax=Brachionichthys hirsutus TaxID=412623 RepID=UPI0036043827